MDRKNIVVVDVDENFLHTSEYVLDAVNCCVTAVKDSRDALEKALAIISRGISVDFLIMDIHISGLMSIELVNELNRLNIAVPVSVTTKHEHRGIVILLAQEETKEHHSKTLDDQKLAKLAEHAILGQRMRINRCRKCNGDKKGDIKC